MKKLVLGAFALALGVFLLAGPNAAGAQAAGSCFVFNNDLSYGMTFGEVLELQKFLAAEGSFTVELTGSFGPLTKSALAQYQSKNGIQATGYFGPATRAVVNADCGEVLGAYALASSVSSASTSPSIMFDVSSKDVNQIGGTIKTQWTSNNVDTNKTLGIYLFSSDTGVGYTIKSGLPLNGSYDWVIPKTIASAEDYRLSISTEDKGPSVSSEYSATFEIIGSKSTAFIKDVSSKLKLSKNDDMGSVKIKYKTSGNTSDSSLKMNVSCPDGIVLIGKDGTDCGSWIDLNMKKTGKYTVNFENTATADQDLGFTFDLTDKNGTLIQRVFEFVKIKGTEVLNVPAFEYFKFSKENREPGQPVVLSWSVLNVNRCIIQYSGKEENIKPKGRMTVYPNETTSYKIWCADDPGTGKDGPSVEGTLEVKVQGSSSEPSIKVLYPNGGEKLVKGETYKIKWKADGIKNFDIVLDARWERNGPDRYIAKGVSGSSFEWLVPSDLITSDASYPSGEGPEMYQIFIMESNAPKEVVGDRSDDYFTVVESAGDTCQFTRDLTLGSEGDDVVMLQNFLQESGFLGTSGMDKGYFGNLTQSALAKFQASVGISPADGYFGPVARAYVAVIGCEPASVPAPIPTAPSVTTTPSAPSYVPVYTPPSTTTSVSTESGSMTPNIKLAKANNGNVTVHVGISAKPASWRYSVTCSGISGTGMTYLGGCTISGSEKNTTFYYGQQLLARLTAEQYVGYGMVNVQVDALSVSGVVMGSAVKSINLTTGAVTLNSSSIASFAGVSGAPLSDLSSAYSHISSVSNLSVGMTDPGVASIQRFLNANGFSIDSAAGQPGSVGYESSYFGPATQKALAAFQASKGISPANGTFGPQTRAVMSQ